MTTRTTGTTRWGFGVLVRRFATRKPLLVALGLATVLTASVFPAAAEEPQAVKVGASSAGDSKRLAQSSERLSAERTKEPDRADRPKSAGAADRGRTGPGRRLTTQQKRIFVLGLGASEKK